MEQTKAVDQKRLTVLVVDHENQLNVWRARYMKLEIENGKLTAQIKILLNEMDVTWMKIGEFDSDKTGKLQRELENMKQQFELLSKNYRRAQQDKSSGDLR